VNEPEEHQRAERPTTRRGPDTGLEPWTPEQPGYRQRADQSGATSLRVYECAQPLNGSELEVRTSTDSGMHRLVSVRPVSSTDGETPATMALSDAEAALVRSTVMAFLDLAGHESGPALTSLVLTTAGPRVRRCEMSAPPS